MAVTVRPVQSRADLRRFIQFPYDHYRDDAHWVPQLRMDVAKSINPKKNPFFEHGKIQTFLATDDAGRTVGRVAGIVNGRHLEKYNDATGFFGFFETVDEAEVSASLLNAASEWLREQGMQSVRGPTNPSMNDTCGLLTDGFDQEPSIMMPYNKPYYPNLLAQYGFEEAMVMWAYYLHQKYVDFAKLKRGVEIVKKRNPKMRLRNIELDRFDAEARTILQIYNEAWQDNWGHVPMSDHEFAHLAKEMKQVIDPRLVFIIEDDGKPVAFSVTLPNLNVALKKVTDGRLFPLGLPKLLARAKLGGIHECRNLLMGILKPYQGRGYDAVLNLELIQTGPQIGYEGCEMSWVLDSNARLVNAVEQMGAVRDKRYAMVEKRLN